MNRQFITNYRESCRIRGNARLQFYTLTVFITALGPTQAPIQWVPGALSPAVKRGRGVMLTTHPVLVPRLRKRKSYTSCHPNAPLCSVTGPLYLFNFYCIYNQSCVCFEGVLIRMSASHTQWRCCHIRSSQAIMVVVLLTLNVWSLDFTIENH
jgi:hypothetical protein